MPPPNAVTDRPKPSPDAPDAFEDPVAYLRSKGWKPLGLPQHANCRWLDPLAPRTETWSEEPIMAWHPAQAKGQKPAYRQVSCPTGHVGQKLPGVRKVCHPAGVPMDIQQALMTQLDRDGAEQHRALTAGK